ncbi:MAG: 50S ribosomal protein L5 [Candidatus Firestonebacteria bacterium]
MSSRLKEKYEKEIVPAMMQKFNLTNKMQVPRLEKIVLNVGLGEAVENQKLLDIVVEELATITGQHPVVTRAKKSISNFKIRKGLPVGCKVTVRGERMFEFLDRFISVALPRIRDFRGLPSKSFDNDGNCSIGLKEQIVFPEIDRDKVSFTHGMDIIIVTTAKDKEKGKELLKLLGMPYV